MDKKYYINVKELMLKQLPRPRLKRTVVYDRVDGFLRIIGVECEV